ncbi:something about silencing protein 10 [Coemansia erecta]|uniref:Something about silencing protein 10 n=1 Tax=Coemansia erecta TaxID=147472 RepID=A0A9W8CPP5_9FUNG|nr:something about silencing protein 10 [Coemansia erecta]
MAGRSKKRAGKRSGNTATAEVDEQTAVRRGGSVKAIRTWNDVEHDSDEDFDDSRDKVLLDYDRRTARRGRDEHSGSESDNEVFGVTAADSDGESGGSGEDSDNDNGFYNDSDGGSDGKGAQFDDGAWGKQRENYYFADDMGEDSADDDAAYAEEAEEALRLQKRQLEALDEGDFIDEFGAQLGVAGAAADGAVARLVTAVDDGQAQLDLDAVRLDGSYDISDAKRRALLALPEPERLRIVQAESPELPALVGDFKAYWDAVRSEVRPVLDRAAALGVGADDHPALAFYAAKYQLLMGYVNNVAVYLVLKASTPDQRGGVELRDHPVIAGLVEFRRRIEVMAALQQRLAPLLDLFAAELRSGTVGAASAPQPAAEAASDAEMAEMAEPAPSKAPRRPSKASRKRAAARLAEKPFLAAQPEPSGDSYAELQKMLRRAAKAAPQTKLSASRGWDALEDGDFGEQEHLDADDAEDKARAVRRLRHHAKRIAQAQTKREARGKLSGDADVPYKTRRAGDLQRIDDRAAEAIRSQADRFGDDLGMDVDGASDNAGASDAEADAYYREIEQAAAREKAAKDARRSEQWRMMVDANVAEEAAVEGEAKRAVNYQILKNKGLMPRRTKEQRNPRVKRRMRFEKAKKKLGSAVVQARAQTSSYGGEATGIKTALSRSTRFK